MCELIIINKKQIYICEKHHHVLKFWYSQKKEDLYLLTFDHHTDLHRAFQGELNKRSKEIDNQTDWDLEQNKLLESLVNKDFSEIDLLRHDEHIDAAILLEVFKRVLIYSYDSYCNKPQRVYCIGSEKYNGQKAINNYNYDESDKVIETEYLMKNFEKFDFIGIKETEWLSNFILDIDLDFFKTKKSIDPDNVEYFKYLIKNCKAITVAKESTFVNSLKEDEDLSSEYLLKSLLNLINEV